MQILFVIVRKTWGWGKKKDTISLSQLILSSGMEKTSIIRARKKLIAMNLITVYKKENEKTPTYCINSNFNKWISFTKKQTFTKSTSKRHKTVYKKANENLLNYSIKTPFGTLKPFTKKQTVAHNKKTVAFTKKQTQVYKKVNFPHYSNKRNSYKRNNPQTPLFKKFWDSYPKKVLKKQTQEFWEKTNFSPPEINFLFRELEKAKKSKFWNKSNGRFIPSAHKWLTIKHAEYNNLSTNAEQTWFLALEKIKKRLKKETDNHEAFDTWFSKTVGLSRDDLSLIIGVPNTYTTAWIQDHYSQHITDVLDGLLFSFEVIKCEV